MRIPRWGVLLASLLLIAGNGCGSGGPERASVSGTVTYNGEAIPQGTVTLTPVEGTSGPTAGGTIAQGAFEISEEKGPVLGRYRVSLNGRRGTGVFFKPLPGVDKEWERTEPVLPEKYEKDSDLFVDIVSGENKFEWNLTGEEPGPRQRKRVF